MIVPGDMCTGLPPIWGVSDDVPPRVVEDPSLDV